MARRKQTRGACAYCGRELTRGGMTRHLPKCPERQRAVADAGRGDRTWTHLQVQDAFGGDYWLHLEMDAEATLGHLDEYLRAIWLECCGHMSQFSIGGWGGEEIGLDTEIGEVLREGVELTHIYDFGTESVTLIKAVGERERGEMGRYPITLMARNAPPELICMECDRQAAWLCMECIYDHDRDGTLCEEHARAHEHDDYGEPMPIVNSPRTGLCGYMGPAEPPY